MKIGIDFGMTNSTISYYDDTKKESSEALIIFRTDAGSNEYIPTVITYNKNGSVSIGKTAKASLTKHSVDAYENFKLLLGTNSNEYIEGKNKTPIDVTHDFIGKLLELFISKQRKGTAIECIVMTVPEIWAGEKSNRITAENIEAIFKKLGHHDIQLISEPLAATAYFCHAYKHDKK